MSSFPKRKEPSSRRVLDEWIQDRARETGEDASRLRRNLGYMAVSAVLAQLRDEEDEPLFILKGGVAMHLRFRARARSSRDHDVVFRRELVHLERVVAQAPSHPIGRFRVRLVGRLEKLKRGEGYRGTLKVDYNNTDFTTVKLEVSAPEGRSVDLDRIEYLDPDPDLPLFGLPRVGPFPAMAVPHQIAQKLHAVSEVPADGRPNDRVTDLLDLQLLSEIIGDDDWRTIGEACEEVFAGRALQPWPPALRAWPDWTEDYAQVADEFGFPVRDLPNALDAVRALIAHIAGAAASLSPARASSLPARPHERT